MARDSRAVMAGGGRSAQADDGEHLLSKSHTTSGFDEEASHEAMPMFAGGREGVVMVAGSARGKKLQTIMYQEIQSSTVSPTTSTTKPPITKKVVFAPGETSNDDKQQAIRKAIIGVIAALCCIFLICLLCMVLHLSKHKAAEDREEKPVATTAAPVETTAKAECTWLAWEHWSLCSAHCGEGSRSRTRRDSCDKQKQESDDQVCKETCLTDSSVTEETVGSEMTIENMDHSALEADATAKAAFEQKVKEAIAADLGVSPEDIHLSYSPGSVKVAWSYSPPDGTQGVRKIEEQIRDKHTLAESVRQKLEEDEGIKKVCTGPLTIDHISPPVVRLPPKHTTTTVTTTKGALPLDARLQYSHTDKCMEVKGGSAADGNVPDLWDCSASRSQRFLLDEGGVGRIRWKMFPELCLVKVGDVDAQWHDCNKVSREDSSWEVTGSGTIKLASDPAKCLVPSSPGDVKNGDAIQVGNCSASKWTIGGEDCVWREWADWSDCDKTCGGGQRSRVTKASVRDASRPDCAGELKQSMPCATRSCDAGDGGIDPGELPPPPPQAAILRLTGGGLHCMAAHVSNFVSAEHCGDSVRQLWMLPSSGDGLLRWRLHGQRCLDASGGTDLQMWDCLGSPSDHVGFHVEPKGGEDFKICLTHHPEQCIRQPNGNSWVGKPMTIGKCDDGDELFDCARFHADFLDCAWGDWSDWSKCSESECKGQRRRSRVITSDPNVVKACDPSMREEVTATCSDSLCQRRLSDHFVV